MKRILSLLVIAAMVCSLSACCIPNLSSDANSDTQLNEQPIPEKSEPSTSGAAVPTEIQITLNTYTVLLYIGERYLLEGSINASKTLQWKSSNESVALVNSQGLVTAVGKGVANITCYAEGAISASCTLTVRDNESVLPTLPTAPTEPPVADSFIFPHSSTAYLTQEEVSETLSAMTGPSISTCYAQDAINEIYARNGYIFQNPAVAAYYNAQAWYEPDENMQEANFNRYEQANIQLLLTFC